MNEAPAGDRLAATDTLFRFATAIDTCDWDAYRSVFTDEIDVDYSSYRAGSVGLMSADDWVDRARRLFPGLDASQHSISNVRVHLNGDNADVDAYVRADHSLVNGQGDSLFTIGGTYRDRLVRSGAGWKIAAVRLTVLWNHGNRHVLTLAAERASAGVGRALPGTGPAG